MRICWFLTVFWSVSQGLGVKIPHDTNHDIWRLYKIILYEIWQWESSGTIWFVSQWLRIQSINNVLREKLIRKFKGLLLCMGIQENILLKFVLCTLTTSNSISCSLLPSWQHRYIGLEQTSGGHLVLPFADRRISVTDSYLICVSPAPMRIIQNELASSAV